MSPGYKKSKSGNNEYINLAGIWFFIALLCILGYFIGGGITGFVIYQQTELTKEWDFTNSADYSYDDSLINLSNGASLASETEIITIEDYIYENYYVTQAVYNSHDKTSQISSIGSGHINTDKNKILNVIFNNELNNDDVISMYIKESNNNDIYLCDYNTSCNSPGYGLINYDGEENWYNITISGLDNSTDRFNIDPDHVKIDYIYAHRIINNSYNIENTTYPGSATIDTIDFTVEDFYSWDMLTVDESLNDQNINYYYSTDSGENWNLINDFNLSSINSSTIRLRAELISDGTNTSLLNSMALGYLTAVACEEDWILNYGKCTSNDTKLKYYIDENNCGTTDNIPGDNSTHVECDYDNNPPELSNILVTPAKGIVGTIINIALNIDDENNISFAEAVISDSNDIIKKLSLYNDNNLYTITWNTTNTKKGTYIIGINVSDINSNNQYYKQMAAVALDSSALGSFTDNSVSLIKNQTVVINATATGTIIEITSKDNLNTSISAAQYSENLKNTTPPKTALGKYVDILVDNAVNNNITKARIVIYFNGSEVNNANIDKNTLRVYYYNETSENWQLLNSGVNTTANYVWAELSHFSTYGVFGEQISASTPQSGGGGSRSSRGNLHIISANKEEVKAKEIVKPKTAEEKKQTPCSYSLNIDLPKKISFTETDTIKGFIKNDGDCNIDKVNLYLNKELIDLTFFENPTIHEIDVGETKEIYLKVKKPISEKTKIFGFAVKPVEEVIKSYSGELISEGMTNNALVVQKKISIDVDVLSPSEEITINPILFLAFALLGLIIVIFKNYKKNHQHKNQF